VPHNRLYQIIAGKRELTADTAMRLSRYFSTSPEFWMNLRDIYELDVARQKLGKDLNAIPRRATEISAHRSSS
jgi:plasmid maintenance system antidote protein VapI